LAGALQLDLVATPARAAEPGAAAQPLSASKAAAMTKRFAKFPSDQHVSLVTPPCSLQPGENGVRCTVDPSGDALTAVAVVQHEPPNRWINRM
jgi:hypothetical protein